MPTIRNLAVGLPVRDGHVLVSDATDSTKGEVFHRALGGGIEFGETADTAVRREFVEELGVSLTTVQLLGVVENIFDYEGVPGHEIVHVFAVQSKEIDGIPLDAQLRVLDEGSPVGWRRISRIDRPLYPIGTEDLLRCLVQAEI
jgi:ADP-ribose pyrophosphatase YjhB (NUDIX family)